MELRLAGKARATRDVDLDWTISGEDSTELLIEAARLDLGDFFEFEIRRSGEVDVGPGGGVRFRADGFVGGRLFEQLIVDVAFDLEPFTPIDRLWLRRTSWTSPGSSRPAYRPFRSSSAWPRCCTPIPAATDAVIPARGARTSSTWSSSASWPTSTTPSHWTAPSGRSSRAAPPTRCPPRYRPRPPPGRAAMGPRRGSRHHADAHRGREQVARLLDPLLAGALFGAIWEPVTLR